MSWLPWLCVAAGGAVGCMTRYGTGLWLASWFRGPAVLGPLLATMLVNVVGAFIIGVLMTILTTRLGPERETLRLALVTGLLGGLTTFSTFSWETWRLIESGRFALATTNAVVSVSLCVLATMAGAWLAHRI